MASETAPSVDALCELFATVIDKGEDADLAIKTVREKKSVTETIAALTEEGVSMLKEPSVATSLRVMGVVAEISDCNLDLLGAIGSSFRHMSLSDVALNYFDVQVTGLDQVKWERELFRLEPTAVMASLVTAGSIMLVPQEVRLETERLLRAAVEQGFNLSTQPLGQLREMADSRASPPRPTASSAPGASPVSADVFQAAVETIRTIQRLQAVVVNPRHIGILMAAGLVSPRAISMLDPEALAELAEGQISLDQAVRIHHNAFAITARKEQTWVEMVRAKSDNLLPATRAEKTSGDGNGNKDHEGASFLTLFESLQVENLGNHGAESALSPAAYLADLLDALRNHVVSLAPRETLLDKLQERRSDLGLLQLTSDDTDGTISYLDLANEVMERYLAKKAGNKLGKGYPEPVERPCADSAETVNTPLIEPSNIQLEIYSKLIQPTVSPLNHFPYNYGIDFVKTALASLGLSLQDLLIDFTSGVRRLAETLPPGTLQPYSQALVLAAEESLQRMKTAQLLGLEESDYVCITHESFTPLSLFREAMPGNRAMDLETYRKTIGYNGCAEYWGYESLQDMLDMSKGGLTFIGDELLKRCGLEWGELVKVLQTSFMRARAIITSDDGCSAITQDLKTLRLRASVGISDDGALTEDICSDLQSFLRLRHRLGWDTRTLDAALCAFGQAKPSGSSGIDAEMVQRLADLKQLSDLSGVAVSELCPLFGTVDRNGSDSLYARLCGRLRLRDDAFELGNEDEDEGGGGHKPVNISAKLLGLSSALQLSPIDLQLVLKACGLDASSRLTLETFSAIYRTHKLASIFGVDMKNYDSIVSLYGFDTRSALPRPGYVLASLSQWQGFLERGLDASELVLKFTGLEKEAEHSKEPRELAHALFAGLQAVLIQWPEVEVGGAYTEADVAAAAAALDKDRSTELVDYIEGRLTVNMSIEDSKTTVRRIPDSLREYLTVDRASGVVIVSFHSLPDEDAKSVVIGLEVDPEKREAWQGLVNSLITERQKLSSDISALVADTTIKPQLESGSRDTRRMAFLTAARNRVRRHNLEALVIKTVQQSSPALDVVAIRSLLSESKPQDAENALDKTVHALTKFSSKKESLDTLEDEQFEVSICTLIAQVRRLESIVTHFDVTLQELRLLQPPGVGLLCMVADLGLLETLGAYQQLKSPLPPTQRDALANLLVSAELDAPSGGNNRVTVEKIADALGWPATTLALIFSAKYPGFSDNEARAIARSPSRLLQIQRMLGLCTKLDVADAHIDSMIGWINNIDAVDKAFSLAAALRKMLEARRTGGYVARGPAAAGWNRDGAGASGSRSGLLMQQLKERRRNALINYLLKDKDLRMLQITSADDLYDFFLIDVKMMGAEMRTSRIRQAISTVQLFVQRCFLGLEEKYGISSAKVQGLKPRWDTIGRFTLREATT